jgi:lysophospholipase L1-like esterase
MRPAPIPHVQVSARLLQEHVNHPSPARPGAAASRAVLAAGLVGSIALAPVAWAQGMATRRRVPLLPPALPPHHGSVPGMGAPIRIVAIGDSAVSGIGVLRSDQTVAAATARVLTRRTGRPSIWRAYGLSGATVRDALSRLLPRVTPEPADLVIIAFGVNDATGYRSPSGFADDLARLAAAARDRVGQAAVVIGGVAPLASFPALPWPLRTVLGWRSAALRAAADQLVGRLPRLVVERFETPLAADLFASDGFHPNLKAHTLWGERIAALALPLIGNSARATQPRQEAPVTAADPQDPCCVCG